MKCTISNLDTLPAVIAILCLGLASGCSGSSATPEAKDEGVSALELTRDTAAATTAAIEACAKQFSACVDGGTAADVCASSLVACLPATPPATTPPATTPPATTPPATTPPATTPPATTPPATTPPAGDVQACVDAIKACLQSGKDLNACSAACTGQSSNQGTGTQGTGTQGTGTQGTGTQGTGTQGAGVPGDVASGLKACRSGIEACLAAGTAADVCVDAAKKCATDAFSGLFASQCQKGLATCNGAGAPAEVCAQVTQLCNEGLPNP
jgi:hypothetical protein